MKLYTFPITTNALKVELVINAAQLDVERALVYLFRGEQKRPAFLAINPMGQIPVLEDNSLILSESNAILIHLAQQSGADFSSTPQLSRYSGCNGCSGRLANGGLL